MACKVQCSIAKSNALLQNPVDNPVIVCIADFITAMLQKSHIGRSVNALRKGCCNEQVKSLAKRLIHTWKKQLEGVIFVVCGLHLSHFLN